MKYQLETHELDIEFKNGQVTYILDIPGEYKVIEFDYDEMTVTILRHCPQ